VIARWEAGDRDPGFQNLQRVARACELELSIALVAHDDHDLSLARQTRDLTPGQRIEFMLDWTRKVEKMVASARRVS
jgi:hypothetical protein